MCSAKFSSHSSEGTKTMEHGGRDVLITGVGLVSSLGADTQSHVARLSEPTGRYVVDEQRFAPYCVHPLPPLDFASQIPKRSDLKQMEGWQRIGVYAAGLALSDANVAGDAELLDSTHLIVGAGSGERDIGVDCEVLGKLSQVEDSAVLAKEVLPSALRPTLFLAQLSNMLAGNISIVHGVTGSSRTFMGEEMAGFAAIENAWRRIAAGQTDLVLVGGALNAEREDLLLGYELGHYLWRGAHVPVWDRAAAGGGFILGSVGAFLVLEDRAHAEARGATAYAKLSQVATGRCNRLPGEATQSLIGLFDCMAEKMPRGALPVLSGASGVAPVTEEELAFLDYLPARAIDPIVRGYGSVLGHGVEAHFPTGLALAALAIRSGCLPGANKPEIERPLSGPMERALLTGVGHWRGEGLALVEAAQ